MIAIYTDDGEPKEVPYTLDGTNKGDGVVRQFTSDHLMDNAGAALSAIAMAEKSGGSPSDFHGQSIYQRVMALPREQRQAWYAAELTKDQTRAETTAYDASVANAAAPYIELVSKIKGTATEKETQFLAAIKGAPSSVIAYLKTNAEVSSKLFEGQGKREDAKLKADEDRAARKEIAAGHDSTARAVAAAIRAGKESPTGLKAREALSSVDKDIKELHVDTRALRKELRDADDKGRADIQRSIDANTARLSELESDKAVLLGKKGAASEGLDVSGSSSKKVTGAKQMLAGGGSAPAKPYLNPMQNQLMGIGTL